MTEIDENVDLRDRLRALKEEHRRLDGEISGGPLGHIRDQLTLSRLKRRKLALKDEIQRLLDQLHPDIIA